MGRVVMGPEHLMDKVERLAVQQLQVINEPQKETIIQEVIKEIKVIEERIVEVIKEVPIEVIKIEHKIIEVIKEVPKEIEIIREKIIEIEKPVEVFITKEIEVIKEVEKQIIALPSWAKWVMGIESFLVIGLIILKLL